MMDKYFSGFSEFLRPRAKNYEHKQLSLFIKNLWSRHYLNHSSKKVSTFPPDKYSQNVSIVIKSRAEQFRNLLELLLCWVSNLPCWWKVTFEHEVTSGLHLSPQLFSVPAKCWREEQLKLDIFRRRSKDSVLIFTSFSCLCLQPWDMSNLDLV